MVASKPIILPDDRGRFGDYGGKFVPRSGQPGCYIPIEIPTGAALYSINLPVEDHQVSGVSKRLNGRGQLIFAIRRWTIAGGYDQRLLKFCTFLSPPTPLVLNHFGRLGTGLSKERTMGVIRPYPLDYCRRIRSKVIKVHGARHGQYKQG